jgi:hypothetical protein
MSSTPEIYAAGAELTHYFRDGLSNRPATCVTVITDGNVFVTAGLGAGTIMKYADWFILAGGKPVPVLTPIPRLPSLIAKSPPVPIGTKFKWVQSTETYRIAIQTAKGVLQVKSVTDGGGECDMTRIVGGTHPLIKKMFADEDSWRASLPEGGSVTIGKPDTRSFGQQMADAHNPYADDRDRIYEYMRRFKIRSHISKHNGAVYLKTPGACRLRAVIGETEYEVTVGEKYPFQTSNFAVYIVLRKVGSDSVAAHMFYHIDHITVALGKPSFYVLHYGRKIQLPKCHYTYWNPQVKVQKECGCRSDGLLCNTHLYE